MSFPTYEHPTLTQEVTEAERNRAEAWLKDAYANGRLTPSEFDRRIGIALTATTRRELNSAFLGLVGVPALATAVGLSPVHPALHQGPDATLGRGLAAVSHLSVFVLWLFGPALCYGLAAKGSFARREAAKAFNFQLVSFLAFAVGGIVSGLLLSDALQGVVMGLLGVSWFVLTLVGALKAGQGEDWRNPVRRFVHWEVLSEQS